MAETQNNLMLTEQYRPYFLADIVGQERQKKLVGSWLRTGRVPRSILISGEYSAGKTTLGRIASRSILCHNPKDGNACTECKACLAFDKGGHPDFVEMNAASERGIGDMRDLAKKLSIRPLFGKKKIFLLDEAHMITTPGWQAMLKPLEEPPAHCHIVVLTTNPEKIPKTIASRCSTVKLAKISVEECTELLFRVAKGQGLGKAGLEKEHLVKIVKATGAHPRNALHALEQVYTMVLDAKESGQNIQTAVINGFIADVAVADIETIAAGIVRGVLTGKPGGALKRAEDAFAEADQLLTKITEMMRQAMMRSTSPKLMDAYYEGVFEGVNIFDFTSGSYEHHLKARQAVLDAYACFTRLRIETSNFSVPVGEVIGEPIARASLLCQNFLKKAGGFTAEKKTKKAETGSGEQAAAA